MNLSVYELAVEFRRHFHRWPEISTQETDTRDYICSVLEQHGINFQVYGTGIIAQIGHGEKCVAIRGEMDALKVKEETGLPYSSAHEGVMHACGHDMHLGMVLAVAVALKREEHCLKGTVKVVFQPSEEKRPGGARLLLPELLKAPRPQAIFAQHVYPGLKSGVLGFRPGAFFASSDNIIFSVDGKGTHAAMPQNGSDPILATACLVQFYQTLVTKFRSPLTPAVVSVTSIHGGTANNVIPDRVEVLGTVRTHDNALRDRIFKWMDEKSEAICALYGCEYHRNKAADGLPVLMNDGKLTGEARKIAAECLGEEQVVDMEPVMLGEDFAIYLQEIPGVMWVLGVCPPGQEVMPPLHSPKFAPDEKAMENGIRMLMKCIEMVLEKETC